MKTTTFRRVLHVPEASERTGLSEATLRWYRSVGRGPKSFKVGRRIAYYEDEVEAWMREQYERDNPAA
jgi:predicted DNA-binding transcriptional regulator AlpA